MIAGLMMLAVLLEPAKGWYAPNQPIQINIGSAVKLVLTDFAGNKQEVKGSAEVKAGPVDVKSIFPTLALPGTYVLFAIQGDKTIEEFAGTPLVISVLADRRRGAAPGPMVVRVEPLSYAVMTSNKGRMTLIFYYDLAPNTVRSFLTLSRENFFDGLTFHRIVPGFVLQGGDPRGDGTGGPGYTVDQEFNDRPHEFGALSMARNGDPNEAPGMMPRGEFANSAGSQFFICLDYKNTQQLDKRYTVFGKVVNGFEAVKALAAIPIADERTGRPKEPAVIEKVEVKTVDKDNNPYKWMLMPKEFIMPTTQPKE